MAYRRTSPSIPIAVLALIAAAGHAFAVSSSSWLSNAGNWASIAAAVFAFLILVAGGARWVRRLIGKRRDTRAQRKDYGLLDYEPELLKASDAYTDAQGEITEATQRSGEVWDRNQELRTQAQADETAASSHELCAVYEKLLPVMDENARIMRVCLHGLLGSWRLTSEQDRDALLRLREAVRGARDATAGYLRALRNGRRVTATVRKRNWSSSLNESASRQQVLLRRATRTVRRTVWGHRVAVWRLNWLLFLFSVFAPVRKLRERNTRS